MFFHQTNNTALFAGKNEHLVTIFCYKWIFFTQMSDQFDSLINEKEEKKLKIL